MREKRGAEKEKERENDRRYSPFTAHFLLFFPLLSRAANFWYPFTSSFLSEKKEKADGGEGMAASTKSAIFHREKG